MPKVNKVLCISNLRHNEYYSMQNELDSLYADSKKGKIFDNLMDKILSRENILLAYRTIKSNDGSKTPGTDGLTIKDIGCLSSEEVIDKIRFIVTGSQHGYRPKPVRRVEIPKLNGDTRPLGIPCMWDRMVQQCVKQIMEPICEAKFSKNSYGFRPDCSVEHAIHRYYQIMQIMHLHYVVEFDIKSFFDNVNHQKLMRQIWAFGIHDKKLLYIIKQMLKAPIKLPNGTIIHPNKGTPQGGIISPLLANIVLNELDHWVESQWEENPNIYKWNTYISNSGGTIKYGYVPLRKTNLKEMYIVRYADDFRIFCRTEENAVKIKYSVTQWLKERLKLEVSEDKTRVINMKMKYSEFLGFKIKLHKKGEKYTVISHVSDKQLSREKKKLVEQIKKIANPKDFNNQIDELIQYNSMVMGMQNYYKLATEISKDFGDLNRAVMTVMENRLNGTQRTGVKKQGRELAIHEQKRYGKSKMMRYLAGSGEPIYPIGYVRTQKPIAQKRGICRYTPDGRVKIHQNLSIDVRLMINLMRTPVKDKSIEFVDNRISLFSAQYGKCAVSGKLFECTEEIHCHHKTPKSMGGDDSYDNLILVTDIIHMLIHAKNEKTIQTYLQTMFLTKEQFDKLNKLRNMVGNQNIIYQR